jgi:hypothetical protein
MNRVVKIKRIDFQIVAKTTTVGFQARKFNQRRGTKSLIPLGEEDSRPDRTLFPHSIKIIFA